VLRFPQYLLQFPQELDGSRGGDVGPVEEREAAAVDGEGIVGERIICRAEEQNTTGGSVRSYVYMSVLIPPSNSENTHSKTSKCAMR